MNRLLTLFFVLCSYLHCHASVQKTDSILLFNGQALTGEITNAAAGILTIRDVDLDMVHVKQYKIKSIRSQRSFKLTAIDRKKYYGRLQACNSNGYVSITNGDSTCSIIPINEINTLEPVDKEFLRGLNGNVGAGFSYTKASNIGQLNLNADISYITRSFEHDLILSGIASIDSSSFSRDNENLQWLCAYDIGPSWFAASILGYQRNLELATLRRYQEILGPGFKLFTRKTWQLYVITGVAVNQEKNTEGSTGSLLTELPLILRFKLFHFRRPNIQISTSQNGYFSLSQKGRLRYSGSTNLKLELIDDFYLNINPYTNLDTKASSGGSSLDFGTSFGLSYEF